MDTMVETFQQAVLVHVKRKMDLTPEQRETVIQEMPWDLWFTLGVTEQDAAGRVIADRQKEEVCHAGTTEN
jgi:hypothetical protein